MDTDDLSKHIQTNYHNVRHQMSRPSSRRNMYLGVFLCLASVIFLCTCHRLPLWFRRQVKSFSHARRAPHCDYAPTVFTKIINRQTRMPVILYEDDTALAFKSIHPVAPIQFLVIPKKQIPNISCMDDDEDVKIMGHLMRVVKKVASRLELRKGYRVVINNGPQGLQAIYHMHIHVMGGRQMRWPPG